MSTKDEIITYGETKVSAITGETESYDSVIFPNVIRKREVSLIKSQVQATRPRMILDYGCGGGWLSLLLFGWGFDIVGIDASASMVRNAKAVCPGAEFIVSEVGRLPFREAVFDFIVGISILHHLSNLGQALSDLRRVSLGRTQFVFMEPNSINPFSAAGREVFPMEAHTKGEKQFTPGYLKEMLGLADFAVERYFLLFLIAFPIARVFKIVSMKPHLSLARLISWFENAMEKMPGLRHLNSTIVAIGTIRG